MAPAFFEDFPELATLRTRVSGADNVRKVVRAIVVTRCGPHQIPGDGTRRNTGDRPRKRTFSDDEIEALVDEARKAGLRVAAHAHGDEGALAAVKAGVHSIEHGTFMSDETLALMQQKGTYYVPTFTVERQPPSRPAGSRQSHSGGAPARRLCRFAHRLTALAEARGVPLAAGTDLRYDTPELSMADEALALQQAGAAGRQSAANHDLWLGDTAGSSESHRRNQGRTGSGLRRPRGESLDRRSMRCEDIRMIVNDGKVAFRKPE